MNPHRLSKLMEETYRLPRPTGPVISHDSFVAYPLALLQGLSFAQQLWQQSVYQLAYEQALADLRPSLPERDLAGVWN
jgi:hypothetical protein